MSENLEIVAVGKTLHVKASGKLTKESYETLVPLVEKQMKENGKLRILFELHDFHGWTAGALWEDLKFDAKHFRDIGKLAIVGETKWEKGMATFCKPFTTASIQYFPIEDLADARAWVGLT